MILWGRGLGANTILTYEKKPTPLPVECVVLDTVYADIKEVVKFEVEKMGFEVEYLAALWGNLVTEVQTLTGGMDLNHTKPVLGAKSKTMPALFIHASDDSKIPLD